MEEVKGLATDKWYRALTYVAVIALVAVAAIPNDPELRKALVLLSVGALAIGIGEWMNHSYQAAVHTTGRYMIHGYPRRPNLAGLTLDVLGVLLVGRAIWLLW